MEPVAAVPLNDELARARALVSKAEHDVLANLTEKACSSPRCYNHVMLCMIFNFIGIIKLPVTGLFFVIFTAQVLPLLDQIELLLGSIVKLDVVGDLFQTLLFLC